MPLLRFSTSDIPPSARKQAVESVIAAHSDIGIDFMRDDPFSVSFGAHALPGAEVLAGTSSAFRCRTTPSERNFILLIGQGGVCALEHDDGHRVELEAGTAILAPIDSAWTSAFQGTASFVSLALPRALLDKVRTDLGPRMRERLPQSPAIGFLRAYAATLVREDMDIGSGEAALVASHIQDLALLALGSDQAETPGRAKGAGLRAARLAAVKADIHENIRNPGLSAAWLGKRHRMSVRALRDLFYAEGTNVTDYVLAARLDRARDLLTAPAKFGQTITAIAFEAGFGDLSWFYQAFRRRFGMSPSDMRERAHSADRD